MTSLNAQCASTITIVANSVIDDAHWQAFGYKGRPRRGKVFQTLLAPAKLESETTLLRELWSASFAEIVRWALDCDEFSHRELFIAKLMEYAIDGLNEPLWPGLRFATRRDAIDFLRQGCSDYLTVEETARPRVFLARCKSALTQPIPSTWLVGAAFLFEHPNSLVFTIRPAMNQARVGQNDLCDIEVEDNEFVSFAKLLQHEQ